MRPPSEVQVLGEFARRWRPACPRARPRAGRSPGRGRPRRARRARAPPRRGRCRRPSRRRSGRARRSARSRPSARARTPIALIPVPQTTATASGASVPARSSAQRSFSTTVVGAAQASAADGGRVGGHLGGEIEAGEVDVGLCDAVAPAASTLRAPPHRRSRSTRSTPTKCGLEPGPSPRPTTSPSSVSATACVFEPPPSTRRRAGGSPVIAPTPGARALCGEQQVGELLGAVVLQHERVRLHGAQHRDRVRRAPRRRARAARIRRPPRSARGCRRRAARPAAPRRPRRVTRAGTSITWSSGRNGRVPPLRRFTTRVCAGVADQPRQQLDRRLGVEGAAALLERRRLGVDATGRRTARAVRARPPARRRRAVGSCSCSSSTSSWA